MCRVGSLDRTEKLNCGRCMTDTTRDTFIKTAGKPRNLLAPASTLFSLHRRERRYSSGADSETIRDNGASTVPSLGMKVGSVHRTLSEKLTPSLIYAGLISGTTRTFGRRLLRAGIPAGVLFAPDGTALESPKAAWSFWQDVPGS
jgi:hypothetical protein